MSICEHCVLCYKKQPDPLRITYHSESAHISRNDNPSLIRATTSRATSDDDATFTTLEMSVRSRSKIAMSNVHSKHNAAKKMSYKYLQRNKHHIIIIYWVCGNTMCVSTCLVEFVLKELSCYILLPRSRFIRCSGDFSVLKKTVLLFNYYPGGRYRKQAGTTTLVYKIVINCTAAEAVLELVSTFRLACSSHRQYHFDSKLQVQESQLSQSLGRIKARYLELRIEV